MPQTIHVARPAPKKEWSVISMVIFNPIHLNMHRQGPVGTGESFITPELAFAECAGKCMWARALTAAQICLGDTGER